MPKPQRLQELSHLQLHIAAIYAVENEDMQRQVRLEQQEKRHRVIDDGRRSAGPEKRLREPGLEDETEVQSPVRRRTQGQGLMEHGQQLDPQLMAHQSHSPDDVDPFLHCKYPALAPLGGSSDLTRAAQFQVSMPQGPVATPPVGQFHHFPPAPRRLRDRSQAQA